MCVSVSVSSLCVCVVLLFQPGPFLPQEKLFVCVSSVPAPSAPFQGSPQERCGPGSSPPTPAGPALPKGPFLRSTPGWASGKPLLSQKQNSTRHPHSLPTPPDVPPAERHPSWSPGWPLNLPSGLPSSLCQLPEHPGPSSLITTPPWSSPHPLAGLLTSSTAPLGTSPSHLVVSPAAPCPLPH